MGARPKKEESIEIEAIADAHGNLAAPKPLFMHRPPQHLTSSSTRDPRVLSFRSRRKRRYPDEIGLCHRRQLQNASARA